jgi:hypothetical protein
LIGRRSETICGRRGDGRDERFGQIDIHATALAGITLILVTIIAFLVELAKGKSARRTADSAQSAAHLSGRGHRLPNPRLGPMAATRRLATRPTRDPLSTPGDHADVIGDSPLRTESAATARRPRLRLCYAAVSARLPLFAQSSHAIVVAPIGVIHERALAGLARPLSCAGGRLS